MVADLFPIKTIVNSQVYGGKVVASTLKSLVYAVIVLHSVSLSGGFGQSEPIDKFLSGSGVVSINSYLNMGQLW